MKYVYLSLFTAIPFVAFLQEEDESCLPPSKKVVKLIETASRSEDAKTAVINFNEAIKAAPDNAMAYYEYGMYAYKQAMRYYETQPNPALGDKSMLKAEEMFRVALEYCSDYHSNAIYYLAVINYSQKENEEAIRYFKEFLAYNHSDVSRFSEDHSKRVKDVKEILAEMENDAEMKSSKVPFEPKMVTNVSSKNDEYFPMISPDNELMFYTRKLDRANLGDIMSNVVEEFTFSQRPDMNSAFDTGNPFKKPFNDGSFTSYGAATMSVDNKEMIICACKKEMVGTQEYLNCDLYITSFKRTGKGGNDFEWTPLENMGPGINTNDGWEAQPSLSADGNMLYYTAMRPTTRDNDIFVATRNAKGEWTEGVPLDELNTDGKDKSPFLHQDSETLYFVSSSTEERKGMGGTDIFYSRLENGKWSKPKNIGYPINTEADEIGLFVSTDGKLAYYSSRQGGNWNIYGFELYPEARPKAVALIKGEIKDKNGDPVKDASIEIAYESSGKSEKIKVNGDDGKYAAIIKTSQPQDVMITVKKEGHAFDSKLINKEELAGKTIVKGTELTAKPLKAGEAYTIKDILFETNSFGLSSKSQFILKRFAKFLEENPGISIMIQGHTDDVGDDAKNMKLSEDRAQEVKKYLISLGIDGARLKAKGFGETKPKLPNDDPYKRSVNRRTDFLIEKL
ncbi:MAG: OmpA family protein [Bacteroidota bacterium]